LLKWRWFLFHWIWHGGRRSVGGCRRSWLSDIGRGVTMLPLPLLDRSLTPKARGIVALGLEELLKVGLAVELALKGGIVAELDHVVAVGTAEAFFVVQLAVYRELVAEVHALTANLAWVREGTLGWLQWGDRGGQPHSLAKEKADARVEPVWC